MFNRFKSLKIALLLASLSLLMVTGCIPLTEALNPSPTSQDLDIVTEAWDIIQRNYVEKDNLDATELGRGAVKGMIEALDDPYSAYLEPDIYQMSITDLEGSFEGIGAHVAISEEGELLIIAPIPDTPAFEMGIRAGDTILGINDQSTEGMSLAEAVLLIRGPKGTTVKLLVLHEGDTEPVEIEIERAEIEVGSVFFEMREEIAIISITHFSSRTDAELTPVLESLPSEGAEGIIIDLRSNPGGSLPAVVNVTSHFVTEGIVVAVVDNEGERSELAVNPVPVTTDLPVVVLVSEFSASGSEVLSGALQDYGRATIAGQTTFGKGSVNILQGLSDGSGIFITTARWLTPNGRLIEGEGITPDYLLELEDEEAIQWAIDYLRNG